MFFINIPLVIEKITRAIFCVDWCLPSMPCIMELLRPFFQRFKNLLPELGIYKRKKKRVNKKVTTQASTTKRTCQENTHASTKKRTRSRNQALVQESVHEKKNSFATEQMRDIFCFHKFLYECTLQCLT